QRFFNLGTAHGAGLGLSIAQGIVERHGSRLELGVSPVGGLSVTAAWNWPEPEQPQQSGRSCRSAQRQFPPDPK
ncbi:MAG: hypothetical protein R6U12_14320, partial [Thioalkalivibrio sp.]